MVPVGPDQACFPHPAPLMKLHFDRLPMKWRGSREVWQKLVLCTLTRVTSELPPDIHETACVNTQLPDFLQGKVVQGQGRCSVDKSTGCSRKGAGFDSQHPKGKLTTICNSRDRGSENLASAGTRHTCGAQANTHTHRIRIN